MKRTSLTLVALSLLALPASPMPAAAAGSTGAPHHHPAPAPGQVVTVATGLDNPRHLTVSQGDVFVAEAGRGGQGPCITGPEGDVCFGTSGAVTRIHRGHATRVLTGLPSLAAADGGSAMGVTDLSVSGFGQYALSFGLGNHPDVRDQLPAPADLLGTVAVGSFGPMRQHAWMRRHHGGAGHVPRAVADVSAFERTDPDGAGVDSNPGGLAAGPGGWAVADAGGNTLVRAGRDGTVRTLAVFDSPGTAPAPYPPFPPIPMQAVPTSVVRGPDGAWYVSELTGFPFAAGSSRIHRVAADGTSTVYATGLTNVTDLAWHDGALYAVQLTDAGLLAGPEPIGSLVRVVPGGAPQTVAGGLFAPYGVAFDRGTAYVTTCSVCAGGGAVVAVGVG